MTSFNGALLFKRSGKETVDSSFGRRLRVRCSGDFARLFKRGKRFGVYGAKLFVFYTGAGNTRLALTLPHGFGNSVERNRAKRLSREVFRRLRLKLKTGYDVLFLLYKAEGVVDTISRRESQMRTLFKKAGLFAGGGNE